MKNEKNNFKIIFTSLILLIFFQLIYIITVSKSLDSAIKKARIELNTSNEIAIINRAKEIKKDEYINLLTSCKVREFVSNLDDSDKYLLIKSRKDTIQKYKDNNSIKVKDLQIELDVINNGYNPISYIMEKIFNLTSIEFLEYQKNYFFLFLTIVILTSYLIFKLYTKNK